MASAAPGQVGLKEAGSEPHLLLKDVLEKQDWRKQGDSHLTVGLIVHEGCDSSHGTCVVSALGKVHNQD